MSQRTFVILVAFAMVYHGCAFLAGRAMQSLRDRLPHAEHAPPVQELTAQEHADADEVWA